MSDCGAVAGITGSHRYTSTANATIAAALVQGGVDLDCGTYYPEHMCQALTDGAVSQGDIDQGARRVFRAMLRLGFFDPMEDQPMVLSLGAKDVDSAASRALAREAAAQSMVLLKHQGDLLPMDGADGRLDARAVRIAFIGPHANATTDMLSAPQYHGANTLVDSHSPLLCARRRGWNVSFSRGCSICDWVPAGYPNQPCSKGPPGAKPDQPLPPPDTSGIAAAAKVAAASDVAVLFMGADQTSEAENFDREHLGLVGAQEALLSAVVAVSPRVILVLIHGGPIAVESAVAAPQVLAILDAFQPGELGAEAILDVLDGSVAPAGALPYTSAAHARPCDSAGSSPRCSL